MVMSGLMNTILFGDELSCTNNDGSGFYNRLVSVNADIVLEPVCVKLV